MARDVGSIVMIAVQLLVIGIVLPLGLAYIATADEYLVSNVSGVELYLSDVIDPAIITLLTILIPILAVIGIAISFIQMTKD